MTTALFIGRFQPFHNGHLTVVKKALRDNKRLIIGIGSAEDSFQPDNPFTAGERFQMIAAAIPKKADIHIIPIRNINNFNLWVRHVARLVPPFDRVYTGSPLVKKLFLEAKKWKVVDIKKELDLCATDIRKRMIEKKPWQHLVPKPVATLLVKWHAPKRLRAITRPVANR